MTRRRLRALLVLSLPVALLVGACSERLETAGSCPLLCPGQELDVLDALIDPAVELDTTLGAYPFIGYENPLLLASRGDTLDLRAVVRFDSLVRNFTPTGDTLQAILMVDSAYLNIQLRKRAVALPANFVIEAYEVSDTTIADSLPNLLLPFFSPAQLLGTLSIDSADFVDTGVVSIPIDTAKLRAAIGDPLIGMRIGLRITSTEPVELWMTTSSMGVNGPFLRFKPSADSGTREIVMIPSSRTPAFPPNLSAAYVDYQIVADAPDIRAPTRFAVGGLPGNRTYLRFNLPRWLTDSVYVLRARLELTQDPVYGLDEADTVTVSAHLALGGHALTDLLRAASIVAPAGVFISDSIVRTPADSGVVSLEINGALRQWRTVDGTKPFPTALVLRSDVEGISPLGLRFFGLGAAPTLRPRLRISYVPNVTFGRP